MKKIILYLKIAISSKYIWVSLILSFFIFTTINFIVRDLLYWLSIVDPKYIIFWTPDYYAFDSHNIPYVGLNYLFYIFYLILLIIFLNWSNRKKDINLNINKKIQYFSLIYLILALPLDFSRINPYMIFLERVVFDKISQKYGDVIEQDFSKNIVKTPFGQFQMHHKFKDGSNNAREIAPTMAWRCKKDIAEGNEKGCHYYPLRISK